MTKILIILAVVVIGCFIESICVIEGDNDRVTLRSHLQRMRSFRCQKPQLRSISVRELLEQPGTNELFYPSSTVLARCDSHSGCCGELEVCALEEQEDVELEIVVKDMSGMRTETEYKVITAKNHTRCHCISGR